MNTAHGIRWSRVYDYDAYGNHWVQSANHTLTFATPTASSQFNAANNRISQNFNGQATPPAYDAAGNLTSHLHIGAMAYDAENHQTSFTGASGTTTYQYDGDGRRVKKLQGTSTTVFVYDAFGNLAAEYDTQPAPNLLAGTNYRTTDHLGSTRLVTNATGGVVSRRDLFPFGEQIDDTWGSRQLVKDGNTFITYNREFGVYQKFTGKERDAEAGLDFFEARYLSGVQGRFTSTDPLDGWPSDPQSWNKYAYARNNPLLYSDPSGMRYTIRDTSGNCYDDYSDADFDENLSGTSKNGVIYDNNGNNIGTYQRTSFDDLSPSGNLFFG